MVWYWYRKIVVPFSSVSSSRTGIRDTATKGISCVPVTGGVVSPSEGASEGTATSVGS